MKRYPSLPILSAAQMRVCDSHAMRDDGGVPSQTLMERAALAVVRRANDAAPGSPVTVLCGGGNNGGDGFAAARFLSGGVCGEMRPVRVLYLGRLTDGGQPDVSRMSVECARQYGLASAAGVPTDTLRDGEQAAAYIGGLSSDTLVIDAVFGIGLDRPVTGLTAEVFRLVNRSGLPVLAVDIPSGINADTGTVMGQALSCASTVTMQALKPGHLLYPGADACGSLTVADIGISVPDGLAAAGEEPAARLVGADELTRALPPRARRSHKGTYGTLALAVGTRGMAGAAVLAAGAALRTGAGLALCVTPQANRVILQTAVPEAVLSLYNGKNPDLPALHRRLFRADGTPVFDGLVIGCGLGTTDGALRVLSLLLDAPGEGASLPCVIDADALNLISRNPGLWETGLLARADKRVVITPHPAEMSRLCGKSVKEILADTVGTARTFSRERGVTVVLKDAHTVIAGPDGSVYLCAAGNAGMAKGGSGDVLAGIIGSLLVQNRGRLAPDNTDNGDNTDNTDNGAENGITLTECAAAGVLLHAMAGDDAAQRLGESGMLASDVVNAIPLVTKGFSDSGTKIGLMR